MDIESERSALEEAADLAMTLADEARVAQLAWRGFVNGDYDQRDSDDDSLDRQMQRVWEGAQEMISLLDAVRRETTSRRSPAAADNLPGITVRP
jgi:hypothetical protein